MPNIKPTIKEGFLLPNPAADSDTTIVVGSERWFEWLDQYQTFYFNHNDDTFTARKERRGGGFYWYAYRRYQGKLYSAYIGKSADLTLQRLRHVASVLIDSPDSPSYSRSRDSHLKGIPPPSAQQHDFLMTKLLIPTTRHDLVLRHRLFKRLDTGVRTKLTLISAPPGYGKTTLLSSWCARVSNRGTPVAWVSLDTSDNDPARFWGYVISALRKFQPKMMADPQAVWHVSPQSPQSSLTTLLNEVRALATAHVLVLEDYHVITNQAIHDALTFLLDHLPPALHIIIASRNTPPLPLARLRARGQMAELGMLDLRFTIDEAAAFLNTIMHLDLSPDQISVLDQQTEGWIAGLQIAALTLQAGADVAHVLASFSGSHRYIVDYLSEEILCSQPEPVYQFLLQTSILNHLTAGLCDYVVRRTDSQAMLEYLEATNLFLVPLDSERRWYRYHHLFADMLRSRVSSTQPEQVEALHRRAYQWYEEQDLVTEAIHHALLATDFDVAAELIERIADIMLTRGEVNTLFSWLNLLPADLMDTRPRLCLVQAWALLLLGHTYEIETWLQKAERIAQQHMDQEGETETAASSIREIFDDIAALGTYVASFHQEEPQSIAHALRSLEQAPEDDLHLRSLLLLNLGEAYWREDDIPAAMQVLNDAAALSHAVENVHTGFLAINNLAQLQIAQGYLHHAADIYRQALDQASESSSLLPPSAGLAYIGLCDLSREWNNLDDATRYLREGIGYIEQFGNAGILALAHISLARLLQAQGDLAGVHLAIAQAEKHASKVRAPRMRARVTTWKTRILLGQGHLREALKWANTYKIDQPMPLSHMLEVEYLLLARVRIAEDKTNMALRILEPLRQAAEAAGRTGSLIEIGMLQALALSMQGRLGVALKYLSGALQLAEPEGYIRLFADEGLPIAVLLEHLLTQSASGTALGSGVSPSYITQLLTALDIVPPPTSAREGPRHQESIGVINPIVVEPLSDREYEVLRLLAAGLSNQEIAEHLTIAVSTVKTHIKRIYEKLAVNNRTQAVIRGKELKLL